MKERIIQLFTDWHGHKPEAILQIAADGSERQYFRLVAAGGATAVGAIGPDREENRAFLSFARAFRQLGLPVPQIYGSDEDAGVWLEEDLGDTTLFNELSKARLEDGEDPFPWRAEELYRATLSILPRFQVLGDQVIDYSLAYPRQAFDEQSIRWDLNYFKYHFLKLAHIPFSEQRLEHDFDRLTAMLLEAERDYFLYRDFQSRNVMVRSGQPWFIDFQGGRKGALHYDVASLLYDAKANLPQAARDRLLQYYLDALGDLVPVDPDLFRDRFIGFVLARLMQAMGAFGYRGFFERKRRFLESVPFAAKNLAELLERGLPTELPELEGVYRRIADRWHSESSGESQEALTVVVQSFSFKDGYPPDESGHGGGFVFDCRALPNPGRRPEFAELTGEARSVADYLEQSGRVRDFWEQVRRMVDWQVEDYTSRGFHSLTVSFGCTGGQHRSVYLAEKLSAYLRTTHPHVQVQLAHRGQSAWPPRAERV